jgi:nitrate reductase gamma subunit
MEAWLEFARGPLFIFAFVFMLLGLARHVVLTAWELVRTLRRAGDKSIPYGKVALATLKWLLPAGKLKDRFVFTLTSLIFHVAILIVPVFLAGHIALWARGLGVSWPAIPNEAADVLTIVAVLAALSLVVQRVAAKATRALSRFQDYALPLLIAVPFVSGFLMMHPDLNPFSFEACLLVHVLSGNLIFILVPLTKLSHMALVPGTQLVSEVAWHWPQDGGSKVGLALGKEKEPV